MKLSVGRPRDASIDGRVIEAALDLTEEPGAAFYVNDCGGGHDEGRALIPSGFELHADELTRAEACRRTLDLTSNQDTLIEGVDLTADGDHLARCPFIGQREAGVLFEQVRDVERRMDLDPQRIEITDAVDGTAGLHAFPRLCVLFEYDPGERRTKHEGRVEPTRLDQFLDILRAHARKHQRLAPFFESRSCISQKRRRFRSTTARNDPFLGELFFTASCRARKVQLGDGLDIVPLQ